jgi:hypothetical protein
MYMIIYLRSTLIYTLNQVHEHLQHFKSRRFHGYVKSHVPTFIDYLCGICREHLSNIRRRNYLFQYECHPSSGRLNTTIPKYIGVRMNILLLLTMAMSIGYAEGN